MLLEAAINPELGAGKSPIKPGFDPELDRLRNLVGGAEQQILALEAQEILKTGINSLKIRSNDIYGYSIEITKANAAAVPSHYLLQQTLVGKNRYVTPELKALERDINNAREQIDQVEAQVFAQVKQQVLAKIADLRCATQALATLDAIFGFATAAYENNYCKPTFTDERDIVIEAGRHPVVERAQRLPFVPNDTSLCDAQSLWIITGPNMGGKSTYLRQVALICLMAQAGSMVPASKAKLPILDRIFTRIGSGDNLAAGKSTFLVEMEEAAVICRQATERSLVILDEVGRGTSTFDGMAIAQAIIEYIYAEVRARCLFATHYHELTEISASQKTPSGIIFLHEIAPGIAGSSFGIEVAKLAMLPVQIIARSEELVQQISARHATGLSATPAQEHSVPAARCVDTCEATKAEAGRLKLLLSLLKRVHPDNLTPRQAHDLIMRLWQEEEGLDQI
jgi:DNA mismatch repair protein MutS